MEDLEPGRAGTPLRPQASPCSGRCDVGVSDSWALLVCTGRSRAGNNEDQGSPEQPGVTRTTSKPPPAAPALTGDPLPFGSSQLQASRWPAGPWPSPRAQMAVLGTRREVTAAAATGSPLPAKATGGPSLRQACQFQPHGCLALPCLLGPRTAQRPQRP